MELKGFQRVSLLDYPGKIAAIAFVGGCNFRCGFCFEPHTKVLTTKGPLTFEKLFGEGKSVKIEDGFVSFHNSYTTFTHTGKLSKIVKVYKHPYVGKLMKIKPYYLPELKVTPNHHLFVFDKRDKAVKKVTASEIEPENHFLLLPKLEANGGALETLDLKKILSIHRGEFKKSIKVDEAKAKDILDLHYSGVTSKEIGKKFGMHPTYIRKLIGRLKKEGISRNLVYEKNTVVEKNGLIKFKTSKSFVKRFVPLNEDFATLLGYYCAEGHVCERSKRVFHHSLTFSFGKHKMSLARRTKELIKKVFGLNAKIAERQTTITVSIANTPVALLFKTLANTGSNAKRVPENILKSENKKIIHSFLKSCFEGDGYKTDNYLEYITCSEELAHGIFYLILRLGLMPSFHEITPNKKGIIEGRIVNRSPYFVVRVAGMKIADNFLDNFNVDKVPKVKRYRLIEQDGYYLIQINKVLEEDYSGFVYNLEVEDDDHSYLANFALVENCYNRDLVLNPQGVPSVSEEEILRYLEANRAWLDGLVVTGGEPTIHPELPGFLEKVKNLGYSVKLDTNGSNPEMLAELLERRLVDYVALDVKAPLLEERYREVVGAQANGAFEDVKKSVELLRSSNGVDYEFRTTVVPNVLNKDDIALIAEQIKGAKRYYLQQFKPNDSHVDSKYSGIAPYPFEYLREIQKQAAPHFQICRVRGARGHE